ncbi:MAG: hypothetical protein ACJASF_002541, partial [Vicingaceae bacterium]
MKNQQLRSYTKLLCSALRAVFYLSAFIFTLTISAQTTTKGFQWIQHHGDGITKNDEKVEAIQTDRWGNIYVAGQVNDLFVRDSSGTNIKSKLNPLLDSLENYGGLDVWLAKYDPQGNLLWHRYAGGGGDDAYYDMVADENGNCYISGSVFYHNVREHFSFNRVPLLEKDFSSFIAKVNSNGDLVWHKTFGGDTVYLPGANGVYVPYFANPYNLSLQGNTISCFFRGGGDQGFFGYQKLFNQDSLQNGIHEAKFDLNGNYLEAHTLPFPRLDRLPQITSIQSNQYGTVVSGNLNRDTVLVGNDTLVKTGSDNAFAAFFDTSYNYTNTIYGSSSIDQFPDASLYGDTLLVAGHFSLFQNKTVRFDTVTYTGSTNEGQAGGIFIFDATSNRLLGLYPSKSIGTPITRVDMSAAYVDQNSFGVAGIFDYKMTFTGSSNYIEAVDNCINCRNSDLFFTLFDRTGNSIAEDVIYTSARINSAIFAMHRKDSMLYIGGFVGDSVIIEGVDTFVTRGSNDAFVAAYNVGLVTSIKENSTYVKADNGILAYPNPTQGQ